MLDSCALVEETAIHTKIAIRNVFIGVGFQVETDARCKGCCFSTSGLLKISQLSLLHWSPTSLDRLLRPEQHVHRLQDLVPEIGLEAELEFLFTDERFEISHHDGCFLIEDRAVDTAGIFQIVERLLDGVRPFAAIDIVGRRVVGQQEAKVVIDLREGRARHFRRHKIGEHLLQPHIVEPFHCDQVSKPHVGRLVGDEAPTESGWSNIISLKN